METQWLAVLVISNNMPEGLVDVLVETSEELTAAAETWIAENPSVDRSIPRCIENTDKHYAEVIANAKENVENSESLQSVVLAFETGINTGWSDAIATEQCELIRLRSTQAARKKLEAFLSKG